MSKFLQATSIFVCILILVLTFVFGGKVAAPPAQAPAEPQAPVLDLNDNGGTEGLEYEMLENGTFGVRAGEAIDLYLIEIPPTHHGLAVTEILDGGFADAPNLIEIKIANSVKRIGKDAFSGCKRLQAVTLSTKLTRIEENAFYACDAIEELTLPEKLTYIGDFAFYNCRALTEIVIPDSVTELGDSVFYACDDLKEITLGKNLRRIGYRAFSRTAIRRISLPAKLEQLGEDVFSYCTSLRQVVLGSSLMEIPLYTFEGCKSLRVITFGERVTAIRDYAFYGSGVDMLVIPEGVISIGERVFMDAENLTALILPRSLERIGAGIHYGDIYYCGTEEEWREVNAEIGYSKLYFYSETEPENTAYFWHYVNGDPVLWSDSE